MLGGASFTDLRRIVIDKMISAGGWVVNDCQREINGASRVRCDRADAASNGKPEQVWNFYFTEVDGRIYSLDHPTRRQQSTNAWRPKPRSSSAALSHGRTSTAKQQRNSRTLHSEGRHSMPLNESAPQISLSELLRKLSELGGSDLHITTGSPPQVRVDGPSASARRLPAADLGRHEAAGLLSSDRRAEASV